MIVSGPTSCGKTHFLKDMLQQNEKVCSPAPERIVWLYKRWQPLYGEIQRTVFPRVEFMRGIPIDLESDSFFDPRTRNMIVLDDLMSTSAKDPRINDLFTEGSHHRNLSVVVLNQNLYFSRDPTQRRNCHYLVLFNNPVDRQPIMTLGRQMYPSRAGFLLRKFEEATNKPFGYLVVDLKATTPDSSRLRTDVLQTGRGMDSAAADEEMDQSEDDFSVTSEDSMDNRKDLVACPDCGVVFAHVSGLVEHVQRGCGKSTSIDLPMTGEALQSMMKGIPVTICCADDLPAHVSDRPQTFVVNTDTCDEEGSHWVVFHFPAMGMPEFFDSMGNAPETYQRHFRNVLILNGPQYNMVRSQLQPDDSDTCGLYCVYYVKMRARGFNMADIVKDFSIDNLNGNDSKLVALFG